MKRFAHIPWIELHAVDHCNNVCRDCNQRSPHSARRDYAPGDYLPWLKRLDAGGVGFDQINITGGEPFLHPDLAGFAAAFRGGFPDKNLVVISNGFWLSDESFAAHEKLFGAINALVFSIYPNIAHAHGGRAAMLAKLGRLKERHPGLEIITVGRAEFYPIRFDASVTPPAEPCRWADCTGLLPDGRLTRCTVAANAHVGQDCLPEPLASRDLYFDLRGDLGEIAAWRTKWPLDVCSRCTAKTAAPLPWKAGAATRRLDYETEYFDRLKAR
ncbi:MAG: radical SAM protein [Desulfovibrionaceae bacterium]|nr:radical SAM protein [Desulfovibrionaceae bacterium]